MNISTLLIVACAKYLFIIPILMAAAFCIKNKCYRNKKIMTFWIVSLVATFLVAMIAGHFYYNTRPFVADRFTPLVAHAANNGFPSDHTLLLAAIACILFPYARRLSYISGALALVVGFARVSAGVHHVLDIVGSIVIALVVSIIIWNILEHIHGTPREKDSPTL